VTPQFRTLLERAGDHPLEDLELSWRKLHKPRAAFHNLAALPPILGGAQITVGLIFRSRVEIL
jgi:hypothetical protein